MVLKSLLRNVKQVFKYVSMWEKMTNQIGYWVDMDDPYVTYHNDYIESVWWALKQMWDKGTSL